MDTQKAGFTLFELTVVIIILAILAALNLPRFVKFRENSIEKEATANLKLIQTGERGFKLIENQYASGSDAASLNSVLKLALPTTSVSYWNYKVDSIDVGNTTFTAKAQRTTVSGGDGTTTKCINETDVEATSSCSW